MAIIGAVPSVDEHCFIQGVLAVMPRVPQQRGAPATPCAGGTPDNLTASVRDYCTGVLRPPLPMMEIYICLSGGIVSVIDSRSSILSVHSDNHG
jgi:hypothetical protein